MTIKTVQSLRAGVQTLEHTIDHCKEQQRLQGRDDALVTFVLAGARDDVKQRRMVPRLGPLGDVLATTPDGKSVVGWKANDLLAFLIPHLAEMLSQLQAWEREAGQLSNPKSD